MFITSARDGSDRTFIVEQGGRILVRKGGSILPTPLLDITTLVAQSGEQGLLGMAFHPNYSNNRKFYVNYTNRDGDTIIREYKTSVSNPDRADPFSPRTVLKIDQPYTNHNGGMLAFGPGGYLYIGMGDGGNGDDPGNRAQNRNSLLGKMLRIDVGGKTSTRGYLIPSSNPYVGRSGRDEIWQSGLRNPWRLLVRPQDRDALDRRRGPGQLRGDRPGDPPRHRLRPGPQLGLARDGGPALPHPVERLHHLRQGAADRSSTRHASNDRCAVTGGYVYRGSADPGARRLVRLRRLLQRRDLGGQGERRRTRHRGSRSSVRAADG